MGSELSASQRLLLQRKIHVAEGAYARSTRAAQQRFPSGWSGAIGSARLLGGLPETAIRWWAEQPNGHLLLTAGEDAYATSLSVDEEVLNAVAAVPIGWLVEDEARALAAALRPLDHLLGCGGVADGRWLSDGGGITLRWQGIGAQIARLFPLGYGISEASRQDPHVYLAEGLALALTDRQALNVNDPKLERLLAASLLSDGFWRRNCSATRK
ncbi:MAG: hypothetical protein HY328_04815 [Chloroflexi bacterium]|nr:hypothetical protein [Chloroflexota bacterium]